jgi:hypothetical protein
VLDLAESDLTYSPETARQAALFFGTRRFLTKFGFLSLGSAVICISGTALIYYFIGTNWSLGLFCTILGMNLVLLVTSVFLSPRASAKAVASWKSNRGHVKTDDEGLTLSANGHVVTLQWARFRYVWPNAEFIVLGLSFFNALHIPTLGMSVDAIAEFEKRASKRIGA